MKPTRSLVLVCLLALCAAKPAEATPVLDEGKRMRMAQIYAPEIRQDREERYGLASTPYFLQHAKLMALLRCRANGKKEHRVSLGSATSLLFQDVFRIDFPAKSPICRRWYDPFARAKKGPLLSAPGALYLQLKSHDARVLLRDKMRNVALPEVSFRVYETQKIRCLRRNWLRACVKHYVRRYYVVHYFVVLMFNEACNEHEGEQEGMMLLLDANSFDAAVDHEDYRKAIVQIGLHAHYKTKVFLPKDVTFVEHTHPVAFMGKGGHGLYHRSGVTNLTKGFAVELRPWLRRICRKRKRLASLHEKHRGGGPRYQVWKAPAPHPNEALATPEMPSPPPPAKIPLWNTSFLWRKQLPPTSRPARKTSAQAQPTTRPAAKEIPRESVGTPASRGALKAIPRRAAAPSKPAKRPTSKPPATRRTTKPAASTTRHASRTLKDRKRRRRRWFWRRWMRRASAATPAKAPKHMPAMLSKAMLARKRKRVLALQKHCLLSYGRRGVRLCDVQPNKQNPPCCLRRSRGGYVRWIQFAGRWGKQEPFASGLAGAAAANFGRVISRWPLGRSLGNSGPFGPRFIHQSTWRWYPLSRPPAPTPATWR